MKTLGAILVLTLCLTAADSAFARDEVMLRDGTTGMVEVLETTPDSVKVKFVTKDGASGQAVLKADNMDPVSFYGIRRKYMEKTVENHAKLAIYMFKNGDFNRAKRQWDLAKNLDPELEQKLTEKPEILEKIAAAIYAGVVEFEKQNDFESAHRVASRLVEILPETPSAEKAREWLKKHEAAYEANRQKEEEARAAEASKADQKELAEQEKVLKPIREQIDKGHKLNAAGLQEKSASKSKQAFDAAASEQMKAIQRARKEKGKKGVAPALTEELGQLETKAVKECVDALLNAANTDLVAGNTTGARKYAEKALEVDPGNARAEEMKTRAQMASTDKFYLDEIRGRRPRTGGGRAGGGRR